MSKKDYYENIEYIQVIKRGRVLLTIPGNLVNGKNETFLANYLYSKLGEGTHSFVTKYEGETVKPVRKIRAFPEIGHEPAAAVMDIDKIENAVKKAMAGISVNNQYNFDFEKILALNQNVFNNQIKFLTDVIEQQRRQLETVNNTPKEETNSLNDLVTMINIMSKLKPTAAAAATPPALASNLNDVPPAVIETLAKIDYSRLSDAEQTELLNKLTFLMKAANVPFKE